MESQPRPKPQPRSSGPGALRLWSGRIGGPLLALAVYAALPAEPELPQAARATAAVGVLMAVLWMSEALPLAVTALLPIVLFPVVGVAGIKEATAPFASDVIFLFLGGFMLALAMERWGLHRRIALRIVAFAGTRATRLTLGFMAATAFLSMWVSNTAATMVMLPIGRSIVELSFGPAGSSTRAGEGGASHGREFATGLSLAIAYAASIGSLSTLIGTPPNLLLRGYLSRAFQLELGFGQWMLFGLPLSVVLLGVTWLLLTRVLHPMGSTEIPGGRPLIRRELEGLGPMSRGERTVAAVFAGTALAWILREPLAGVEALVRAAPWVARLTDAGIAVTAVVLLFAIPVTRRRGEAALDWETARKLPWDVLLLFGGGLSLAAAVQSTGLADSIGEAVAALRTLPLPLLVGAVVAVVILLTELTSNTATAATFLPLLGGVAVATGIAPTQLTVPAALAATCAFMLPVATPPNAIVFGSGYVTLGQMARAGILLNLVAAVLITIASITIVPLVLG